MIQNMPKFATQTAVAPMGGKTNTQPAGWGERRSWGL